MENILMIGSGPIVLVQGMEFDYAASQAIIAYQEHGHHVVVLNSNTSSLMNDLAPSYIETINVENILKIIEKENITALSISFGGQTGIDLTLELESHKISNLGTSYRGISQTENREKFRRALNEFGIKQSRSCIANNLKESLKKTRSLVYPILIRLSYVLAGKDMHIVKNENELVSKLKNFHFKHPILIDEYIQRLAVDVDVVSDGEKLVYIGPVEHLEFSGIHSGDSHLIYPNFSLNHEMIQDIEKHSFQIACFLNVRGLLNIQMIIKDQDIYVIEVNPRESRTLPFLYRASSVDLIDKTMKDILSVDYDYKQPSLESLSMKAPIFSFEKLEGGDPILEQSMKSTGEIMENSSSYESCLLKLWGSQGLKRRNRILYLDPNSKYKDKLKLLGQELVDTKESNINLVYCPMIEDEEHYQMRRFAIDNKILLLQTERQIQGPIKVFEKVGYHETI